MNKTQAITFGKALAREKYKLTVQSDKQIKRDIKTITKQVKKQLGGEHYK